LVLGTAGFFLAGKVGAAAGCTIPLLCESGHVLADQVVAQAGDHVVGETVRDHLHWDLEELGIRCYSLNFCGRLNYVFDFTRRLLAPLGFSFSGPMIHEVIVATIKNPDGDPRGKLAMLLLCKCHTGQVIAEIFEYLEDLDVLAKPVVFGSPKTGWWRRVVGSHGLLVRDVLHQVLEMPVGYRAVTDNCHHFVKEIWNWHIRVLLSMDQDSLSMQTMDKRNLEELKWPRRTCCKGIRPGSSASGQSGASFEQSGSEPLLGCKSSTAHQDAQ